MAAPREWLTRDEIQNEARKLVEAALFQQNAIFTEFKVLLAKIADGAQAQILSSTILHGNPTLGLKGAIPDLQERVMHLEASQAKNHAENQQVYPRLERIEANQGRMKRRITELVHWCVRSENGKPNAAKILAVGTALGTALHYAVAHLPNWTTLKIAAAKMGALMGK